MSFPNPEYIKNFLTTKLTRRNSDNTTLLADDSMQSSSSLEGVTVFKDGEDNMEGFEISKKSSEHCHNHNGSVVQNRSKSNPEKFTSKTPLQLNKLELGCYGAAEQVELNKKENTMKYRKSKASQITGETSYQGGAGKYERLDNESTSSNVSCNSTGREAESCGSDDGHSHSHGYSSDDSDLDSEHCHDESDEKEQTENRKRKKALRKLIIATVLSFLFMCGEILGGYLANSLAIMTDASHLLTDVSSFLVSIIALQMAARPSSKSMTFGWHRAEVIGAITSVIAIWVVTGVLVYLAVNRLIKNEYELDGKTMLITAACAVGFNIVMGLVLHESHGHAHGHSHGHSHDHSHGHSHDHGHSHEHKHNHSDGKVKKRSTHHDEETGNVNVRAAFIHVLGDLLQSLGVLVAAFIIYFKPEYKIADPICTFLFSILVLATTITILRDTIVILMEGTPAGINYEKVKEKLLSIQGVIAVHDLRIWSLTLNQCVMSCHLAVDKTVRPGTILKKATKTLKAAYNFHSMTIQVETYSMIMDDCKKCSPPKTPV